MRPNRIAYLLLVTAVTTACASSSDPSTRGGSSAEANAIQQTVAASTQSNATSGEVTPNLSEWERVQQAAQQERTVVVMGPPFPALRQGMVEGFQRAYGISVEFIGVSGGENIARIDREFKAGNITIDVVQTGSNTCWTLGERGQIDNISRVLLAPDVVDPVVWRNGSLPLAKPTARMPSDFHCGLQFADWVMTDLFVNTQMVEPSAIRSWKDLLKAEYRGKIASYDPRRSGPGQHTVGYLYALFGEEFLRNLYVGQEVTLTADHRQLAEWVAQGTYPIGISLVQSGVEPFRQQGLPIERVFPEDGPGAMTSGFGMVFKVRSSPHPNSATLFINWLASKDGQAMYETTMMEMSLRTDVPHNVPEYVKPRPGVEYRYSNDDPEYVDKYREVAAVKINEILGR